MVPTLYSQQQALPRLPNGKLDRLRLPQPDMSDQILFGSAAESNIQKLLSEIWTNLLNRVSRRPLNIGIDDDFFKIGGHSLLAIKLATDIYRQFGTWVSVSEICGECNTIAKQAKRIERVPVSKSVIVPLQNGTGGVPVFCVHPVGGQITFYRSLSDQLGTTIPVYGVQADEHKSLEEMVQVYCDAIQLTQPLGPYRLLGWSSGGLFASAIVAELERRGAEVELLAYIDTTLIPCELADDTERLAFVAAINTFASLSKRRPSKVELAEIAAKLSALKLTVDEFFLDDNKHLALYHLRRWISPELSSELLGWLRTQFSTTKRHLKVLAGYRPSLLKAPIKIYTASINEMDSTLQSQFGIGSHYPGAVVCELDGDHYSILQEPYVETLGKSLLAVL
jgi:thioesterase domain-containing protein